MIDFMTVRRGLAADRPQEQNDIDPVTIIRIITTAQPKHGLHFGGDSRFLLYLTNHGLFDSFVRFDETSRQLPVAAPVTRRASYKQQLPATHYCSAYADVVARIVTLRYRHNWPSLNGGLTNRVKQPIRVSPAN